MTKTQLRSTIAAALLLLAASPAVAGRLSDDLDRIATVALTHQLCGYDAEDETRVLVISTARSRGMSVDRVVRLSAARARDLLGRTGPSEIRRYCVTMRSIVR